MSDSRWAALLTDIVRELETGTFLTVFEQRGRIARLPKAIGGDPTRWGQLAAAASPALSRQGFFELVHAKAHFLLLPKPIVVALQGSASVKVDEANSGGQASTTRSSSPREATMHLPGAGANLASCGYQLGHVPTVPSAGFEILDSIYHEMTHAWLWLQDELGNAELKKLYGDGVVAYAAARGVSGTVFDADRAFSEAAAYYVGDRISRWCNALLRLSSLWVASRMLRTDLERKVQAIVDMYDLFVPVYGSVPVGDLEEKIASPALSAPLRGAIDRTILDGRPLTKPFAETPLNDVRTALLNR